jgi:hypothetical protein
MNIVFIEFNVKGGGKRYFVGTYEGIMADTKNGTDFAGEKYTDYRTITRDQAEQFNLGLLNQGVESVSKGHCRSFMLRQPS